MAPLSARGQGSWQFSAPRAPSVYGSLGYSGVPRIGFISGRKKNVAVGGELILDLANFHDASDAGNLTVAGAVPVKIHLFRRKNYVAGLTLHPGAGVLIPEGNADALFAMLLHSQFNLGFRVAKDLRVGPGLDFPLTMNVGDRFLMNLPLLFGALLEWSAVRDLAITTELKMGPHITAGDGGADVDFGLKFAVGFIWYF